MLDEHNKRYDGYRALYRQARDREVWDLRIADSRLPAQATAHLAHNWGNEAAQRVLDRYHTLFSRLNARHNRELNRIYFRGYREVWGHPHSQDPSS